MQIESHSTSVRTVLNLVNPSLQPHVQTYVLQTEKILFDRQQTFLIGRLRNIDIR